MRACRSPLSSNRRNADLLSNCRRNHQIPRSLSALARHVAPQFPVHPPSQKVTPTRTNFASAQCAPTRSASYVCAPGTVLAILVRCHRVPSSFKRGWRATTRLVRCSRNVTVEPTLSEWFASPRKNVSIDSGWTSIRGNVPAVTRGLRRVRAARICNVRGVERISAT